MNYGKQFVRAILLLVVAAPFGYAAQVGQPFAFYGEEPWGGSYLGVDTENITADRVAPLHLREEKGVEVTMVDQDAPAGKAGIKDHDVILSINDQPVQSVEQLRRLIREIPAGRTISIGISREGQPMTLHAQLAERDKMPELSFHFNPGPNFPPVMHITTPNIPEIDVPNIVVVHAPRSTGIMIENLTAQLGTYFGVKGGNGVLVRSVEKGSRAEQAGIKAGDVIVKINGSAVNDCSDFTRLLRSRNENKASVTVMRDRKEEVLTLLLPPKQTGSLYGNNCETMLSESACAEIKAETAEIASVAPEITAELDRLRPEMKKLKKQVQEEVARERPEIEKMHKQLQDEILSNQGEWKKQMEQMQHDLEKQKEEIQKELKEWQQKAAAI